ncbi:hypothetical protein Dimus_003961 [Dionaea muscipula]
MDSSTTPLLPTEKPPNTTTHNLSTTTTTVITRLWPTSRHGILLRRRRKNLPRERLGGKKKPLLVRIFRRFRFRKLKIQYRFLIKKLKQCCRSAINDVIEGSASWEAMQHRISMEMSMAVPVMGLAFAGAGGSHMVVVLSGVIQSEVGMGGSEKVMREGDIRDDLAMKAMVDSVLKGSLQPLLIEVHGHVPFFCGHCLMLGHKEKNCRRLGPAHRLTDRTQMDNLVRRKVDQKSKPMDLVEQKGQLMEQKSNLLVDSAVGPVGSSTNEALISGMASLPGKKTANEGI